MRILFVYKYLTLGGVETVLRARLNMLSAHGFEPTLWFLNDGPGRKIFEGWESSVFVGSERKLAAFLKMERFDLYLTLDTPEVFKLSGNARFDIHWIVEFHTPYPEAQEYMQYLSSDTVQAVITPSQYQAAQARALLWEPIPVFVCPNPIRDVFLSEPVIVPGNKEPIVSWIGRLDELKNWRGFIDLAGKLLETREDISFWIIGDYPSRTVEKELEGLSKITGVYEKLCWFRGVDHMHIPRFMDCIRSSGGIVLSTSLGESFGMTIAEAMARKCAVVVPDKSPFCEFVEQCETGLFYHRDEISAAVPSVLRLLEDRDLRHRMGVKGRMSIFNTYHPARAIPVLAQTLQQFFQAQKSDVEQSKTGNVLFSQMSEV